MERVPHYLTAGFIALLLSLIAVQTRAADIAIIIDDLGYEKTNGDRAVSLPGAVTLAFLPQTPYGRTQALEAREQGKEIMLHLPMQALNGQRLGPGGLTLGMSQADFAETLRADLASLPPVAGINNHMGSLLTQHPGDMAWLMRDIARIGGLYFIDSRTSARSVALAEARRAGLPAARRNVFLDATPHNAAFVRKQIKRLIQEARRHGTAIAIGHPYATTLSVLAELIPRLKTQGIRLISAGELIAQQERKSTWQKYSSPSPKAAKNSKPSP